MRIGVPKEQLINETRVAATPTTVRQLIKLGFTVIIENNSGKLAGFDNETYVKSGAIIAENYDVWQTDVILKVNAPKESEIMLLNSGVILISFIWPAQNQELLAKLAARGITVMAMDSVPRISRAQSIDALSSMANITGYRAIIEAIYEFGSFFNGQITAAGRTLPAKVMVIGAGVAGLAAIGIANSLGAIVTAFDVRPEVKEQVQSMGAEFLELSFQEEDNIDNKKAIYESEAFIKAEAELLSKHVKEADIIITTVLIPGKPAPKLIKREMINSMKTGSIIVDLAAQNGGNCECTVTDKITTTINGIKIIGYTDLATRLPRQASIFYSNNILNLIRLLCKEKDGAININFDDIIVRNITIIHDGKITWPAPIVHFSSQKNKVIDVPTPQKLNRSISPWFKYLLISQVVVMLIWLSEVTSKEFLSHFTVFVLSCIIGYYTVWNVSYKLHTPLMSITNAISGIIVVGALLQIGNGSLVSFLSFVAIIIASINIFGGFAVTNRMLKMFHRE